MRDGAAYDAGVRLAGIIGGIALVFFGVVWTLQGLGSTLVPQSFMTNSRVWVLLGGLTLAGGIFLTAWAWRRDR